jgi:hypothetical protein
MQLILKNLFIDQKLQFTFPDLPKGHPSYRRCLQHFKRLSLLFFFYFSRSFLPSWIRIQSGSGPQNCHQVLVKEALQTENNMCTKYFNQKLVWGLNANEAVLHGVCVFCTY